MVPRNKQIGDDTAGVGTMGTHLLPVLLQK